MNLLVVLSHLMSKNCVLGEESAARADMAIELFSSNEFDKLVTLGWDYRGDCATPIAEVVSDYIVHHSDIPKASIIVIRESRDTVGDALFCFDYLHKEKLKKVTVITSDYHVERASTIFTHVFSKAVSIKVYGVPTKANFDSEILFHEQQSLEAFHQTFKGVDFSSRSEMFKVLSEKHPFYNGQIHPKISCP